MSDVDFSIDKLALTQSAFLQLLIEQFPTLKDEILDDAGLIYMQVAALATYANKCLATARLSELQRIFNFFHQTVEKLMVIQITRFMSPF